MAVFSAIASFIVTTIGITGFAATLATSIIAGGLALGTSKLLGVFKPPQVGNSRDPGVKIQLPPATDNKVPVMYGRNFTGGIITDAGISNQNKTMTYVLILSEQTASDGSGPNNLGYTVNDIYRDDQKLVFQTGGTTNHIVASVIDPNATSSTNVAGKLRCRVYAGGTGASNQIFPASGTAQSATTMLPTITASTSYAGLVFAVFQIDYEPEENLTGLGGITFDITNGLSEPSVVLTDYLTNARYGAGLTAGDLDPTGFADLLAYSTEQVPYILSNSSQGFHDRWSIDGMFGTYGDVKSNIDTLCQSCATFFTYNPKVGKFTVVPNRLAEPAEKAAAFVFDSDNIVGAIDITSPELYSTINEIEAEYPLVTKKDQTDIVFLSIPAGERNANEPENKLTTRFSLVNDTPRVTNLANIDLQQSRISTVIKLDADYSAIQVDVGDIVKVTEPVYGYNNKLFRVMQVTEQESQDGMLTTNIVGLEYADIVYGHANIQSGQPVGLSGISGWWIANGNTIPVIGNVIINDNPLLGNANIVDPGNGIVLGNIDFANINLPTIGGFGTPFIDFPIIIPDDSNFDELYVNLKNNDQDTNPAVADSVPTEVKIVPPGSNTTFVAGETIRVPVNIPSLGVDTFYEVATLIPQANIVADVHMRDTKSGANSQVASTAPIFVAPKNFTNNQNMTVFGAGVQLEDTPAANVTNFPSSTVFELIQPKQEYDLSGAELGDYSFDLFTQPLGAVTAPYQLGFRGNATIQYANATSAANFTQQTGAINASLSQVSGQLASTSKITVDPVAVGLPADMKPVKAFIGMDAYSTMPSTATFPRGFAANKFQFARTTKGERE